MVRAGIVAKENSGQFKLLLLEYYEQIQYLQIKVVDGAWFCVPKSSFEHTQVYITLNNTIASGF